MTDTVYDLVILGAGSGGYAAALRGAQLGLSVALIEADKIGGTCLHRGCVPTKAILHSAETAEAVREACGTKPTLGICLGEQMLLDESDEGADVHGAPTPGLGLVPGRVVRFDPARMKAAGNLKVPHMGWNRVHPSRPHPLWEGIEPGAFFYFVHSFHAEPTNPANVAATSVYGEPFTCAVTQNNMFATQFHPEKSAASGLRLFRNFIHWRP